MKKYGIYYLSAKTNRADRKETYPSEKKYIRVYEVFYVFHKLFNII